MASGVSALEPTTAHVFALGDGPCRNCKKQRASRNLCNKHLCSQCCSTTFGEYTKKGHNTERRKNLVRPLYALVEEAKRLPPDQYVWIKYHKPGEPPRVHKVRHLRLDPKYQSADFFRCDETRTNGEDTESTYRISRMELLSFGPL